MVLFVLGLVQPTLLEGHPLLQHIWPMHLLLLVSSVGSGTIVDTANGQSHHVIFHQGSGFDCRLYVNVDGTRAGRQNQDNEMEQQKDTYT
jgi:hypothetical protein